MAFENSSGLFEAIKSDDEKAFTSFMLSKSDLNISFGRFPLLSVLYLYKSYNIISKYEKYLYTINSFQVLTEYYDIYKKFRKIAKKSLKLYRFSEYIYPIEILAMQNHKDIILKKYGKLYKNEAVIENLKKIYYNNQISCMVSKEEICLGDCFKRKTKFSFLICSLILVVSILFSSLFSLIAFEKFGLGTARSPIRISSESQFVSALSNDSYYKLEKDLTLSSSLCVDKFFGHIDFNNHTINFSKNQVFPFINNLTGSFENGNFKLNITAEISNTSAFLCNILDGIVKNCVFSGEINIEFNPETEGSFSIFCTQNNGQIDGCKSLAKLSAENLSGKNSYLSHFSLKNNENAKIVNCSVSASLSEIDTVDFAGVSCFNLGEINGCNCITDINSSASKDGWSPNVSGVVIENAGQVLNCSFNGKIESVSSSTIPDDSYENSVLDVFASGICCRNFGNVSSCFSEGLVSAISTSEKNEFMSDHLVYVSGIVAENFSVVSDSSSKCDIDATSKFGKIFAGGVCAYCSAYYYFSGLSASISNSSFDGNIDIESFDFAYAGGVCGFSEGFRIEGCYAVAGLDIDTHFEGEDETDVFRSYIGGLVGFCTTKNISRNLYIGDPYYIPTSTQVKNCYAKTNILLNEETKDKVLAANLIGFYNTLYQNNISNLCYVKDDSAGAVVYYSYVFIVGNDLIDSSNEAIFGIKSYDTLDELLLERGNV